MTSWVRQGTIITLGGCSTSFLNEVQQFAIKKKEWKTLPSLPEKIYGSSATVLKDVLYNIGGSGSTNSICWISLLSGTTSGRQLTHSDRATSRPIIERCNCGQESNRVFGIRWGGYSNLASGAGKGRRTRSEIQTHINRLQERSVPHFFFLHLPREDLLLPDEQLHTTVGVRYRDKTVLALLLSLKDLKIMTFS